MHIFHIFLYTFPEALTRRVGGHFFQSHELNGDLRVIRKGEIKSWSLLVVIGLHPLHPTISIQVLHSVLCTFLKVVSWSFVRVKKSIALSIGNLFHVLRILM